MKLKYYKALPTNFGDDLNPFIFEKIFGEDFHKLCNDLSFYGIGSIIDERIPLNEKSVLFGTGIRNPGANYKGNNWDIRFVRGPITANILNSKYISDSAYCINFLFNEKKSVPKHKVSIIPYFRHMDLYNWNLISKLFGINIISPSDKIENILNEIRLSEKVIAGAMHGAIIADAFRIPWVRLKLGLSGKESPFVSELKWTDWIMSMELEDKYIDIPIKSKFTPRSFRGLIEKIHNNFLLIKKIRLYRLKSLYQISSDKIFNSKMKQFKVELVSFCNIYGIKSGLIK